MAKFIKEPSDKQHISSENHQQSSNPLPQLTFNTCLDIWNFDILVEMRQRIDPCLVIKQSHGGIQVSAKVVMRDYEGF